MRMSKPDQGIPRTLQWSAVAAVSLLGACTTTPIVGGCTYDKTPGTATVTAIEEPSSNLYNCPNDPVRVTFDFAPTDTTQTQAYLKGRPVIVGSGANPNRAYILSKGFAVGKALPAVREDIRSGACSPIEFIFPGIDLSDYAQSCFGKSGADAGAP
jgi:hypothetical protein